MRSYEAARKSFGLFEGLANFVIVVGLLVAMGGGLAAAAFLSRSGPPILMGILGALPGLTIAITGFFGLALSQMGRASVDSAEYAQQSLKIDREQFEISKQLLRLAKGETAEATYSPPNAETVLQDIQFDTDATGTSPSPVGGDIATTDETATPPDTDVLEVISFRGGRIEKLEEGYRVGTDVFANLAIAEEAIRRPVMRAMLPKIDT